MSQGSDQILVWMCADTYTLRELSCMATTVANTLDVDASYCKAFSHRNAMCRILSANANAADRIRSCLANAALMTVICARRNWAQLAAAVCLIADTVFPSERATRVHQHSYSQAEVEREAHEIFQPLMCTVCDWDYLERRFSQARQYLLKQRGLWRL